MEKLVLIMRIVPLIIVYRVYAHNVLCIIQQRDSVLELTVPKTHNALHKPAIMVLVKNVMILYQHINVMVLNAVKILTVLHQLASI